MRPAISLALAAPLALFVYAAPLAAQACDPALGSSDCQSDYYCAANGVCTPTSGGGGSTGGVSGGGGSSTGGGLTNPLGAGTDLNTLIKDILQFVVELGSVVVIVMLVYVGFLFVTARGEPAKLTTARSALLWTIVGALILLGAQAIAIAIQSTVTSISSGG